MVLASFDDVGPFDMEPGGRSSQSSLNHVSKANLLVTKCRTVGTSQLILCKWKNHKAEPWMLVTSANHTNTGV